MRAPLDKCIWKKKIKMLEFKDTENNCISAPANSQSIETIADLASEEIGLSFPRLLSCV